MNDQIYLIGDVHGCYKTLCALIDRLPHGTDSKICFVGDLIDRGEGSFEVVQLAMRRGYAAVMGNHEYRLLQHKNAFLRGETPSDPRWFYLNGCAQTFASYDKANRAQKLAHIEFYQIYLFIWSLLRLKTHRAGGLSRRIRRLGGCGRYATLTAIARRSLGGMCFAAEAILAKTKAFLTSTAYADREPRYHGI